MRLAAAPHLPADTCGWVGGRLDDLLVADIRVRGGVFVCSHVWRMRASNRWGCTTQWRINAEGAETGQLLDNRSTREGRVAGQTALVRRWSDVGVVGGGGGGDDAAARSV